MIHLNHNLMNGLLLILEIEFMMLEIDMCLLDHGIKFGR
jgi:hypothetical protein